MRRSNFLLVSLAGIASSMSVVAACGSTDGPVGISAGATGSLGGSPTAGGSPLGGALSKAGESSSGGAAGRAAGVGGTGGAAGGMGGSLVASGGAAGMVASGGALSGGGAGPGGSGACKLGLFSFVDGTTGIPSLDGCNTCSCSSGLLLCTEVACPMCGGLAGLACEADRFCSFGAVGACLLPDASGICKKRPQLCLTIKPAAEPAEPVVAPVCGCDGVEYGSPCVANGAGTDVASAAPCSPQ